jgi:pimeloyl-ACP methyl ester carboxylesterase
MREDIEFEAQGVTLRGWFYRPERAAGAAPCVVVQHGFSAVKEMWLDRYAEEFSRAGLACVVYDHPGFGASDAVPGTPRQEIDPWQQIRFIQHAITYAQLREEVDAERIGLWGSSYGAAHAYVTAAIDRRVKAVCGQVPLISGSRTFTSLVRVDFWPQMEQMFAADRQARMRGEEPIVLPIVDEDPTAQSALPTPDSYEFFTSTAEERAPSWRNEVTLRSLELFRGYEPGFYLPLISPTPLLMVVAPHDRLAAGEWACAAFETAAHPKKLVLVPGGHFDAYRGEGFQITSAAARDWFVEHLRARAGVAASAAVA